MHEQYTSENTTTRENGRDAQGRFTKGNRGGPGNPHARRCAHLKQLLQSATSDEEVLQVLAVLKRLALGGDVQAIKLFLAYQIGTPAEMPDPDTLDQQELKIALDNHAPCDREIFNVLHNFPADLLAEMLRNLLPLLAEHKKANLVDYLRDPLAQPHQEKRHCDVPLERGLATYRGLGRYSDPGTPRPCHLLALSAKISQQPAKVDWIRPQRILPFVPAGARPFPFFRLLHQLPPYRVGVNVIDHQQDQPGIRGVAVETAAWLPKESLQLSCVLYADSGQPLWRAFPQELDRSDADGLFDRLENHTNFINRLPRPHQNMDVFRHEHIRPKGKVEFPPGRVDGLGQPLTGPLSAQKRKTAKTRKGQFMGVAWIVCRRPTHAPLSPMHDNALMVLQMGIGPLNLSSSAGSVHGRSLWQAWVGVPTQATVRGPPQ